MIVVGSSSETSPKSSQSPVTPQGAQALSPKKKQQKLLLDLTGRNTVAEKVDPTLPLDQQG